MNQVTSGNSQFILVSSSNDDENKIMNVPKDAVNS